MDRVFYVHVMLKTPAGWTPYGQFFVGDEPEVALTLFNRLQGRPQEGGLLRLDLMESRDPAGVRIKRLYCTLDELSENCRIITKEVFKRFTLEKDPLPLELIFHGYQL